MEYLPYIGYVIFGLGIAKLLQMGYAAAIERQKVQKALEITNSGKAIDADVHAYDSVSKRLELVETKLDTVLSQLMDYKVENAELKRDAAHAETELTRQAGEILSLRQSNHGLREELQKRDKTINDLKIIVESLRMEVRAMGGHHTDDVIKVELVENPEEKE